MTAARQATDGPITILAHSAGGWLSRVYLLVSTLDSSLYNIHLLWARSDSWTMVNVYCIWLTQFVLKRGAHC